MEASQTSVKNMETKKDIRKRVLEARKAMTKKEWEEKSDSICEKVTSHPFFLESEEIYSYIDYRNEVGTRAIIEKAWQMGKRVAVPKTDEATMSFYYIDSFDDVLPGNWNILEPKTDKPADGKNVCVIMPGSVFDRNRNRIGYGKGYYDRYLSNHPGHVTIALAFELQVLDEIPSEEFDIKPQCVMTEEKIYAE